MSDFVVIHQNVTFGRLHLEWTFRVLIHGFLWNTKNIIFLFLKLFSKNNMLMHLHLSNFGKIQSLKFLTAFAYPHIFKRLLNLVPSWTDFTCFSYKKNRSIKLLYRISIECGDSFLVLKTRLCLSPKIRPRNICNVSNVTIQASCMLSK